MTSATFSTSPEAQQAAALLEGYRFELGQHDARQWVSLWLEFYRPSWIRDAVIEALYQGRYKSVSVRQILELWQRREQPIRHATHDFEAAVCREFGEIKRLPATLPGVGRAPMRSVATVQSTAIKSAFEPQQAKQHRSSVHQRALAQQRLSARQRSNEWRSHQKSDYTFTHPAPASSSPNHASGIDTLKAGTSKVIPLHRSLSQRQSPTVSFDLSALPPLVPGMNGFVPSVDDKSVDAGVEDMTARPSTTGGIQSEAAESTDESTEARDDSSSRKVMDNKAWRDFPSYTTPAYATSDPDEVLRAQRQFNGVLYSSARAIQPFKPALPFSAQTLRLAKQKAIALMSEAQ